MLKKNSKRTQAPPPPLTKRQLSRYQRERRLRALIFAISGVITAIIIAILVYGFWREFINIANEPVAKVGDKEISTSTLSKVIGYYDSYYAHQIADLQQTIATNQQAGESDKNKQNLVEAANLLLQQAQAISSQLDAKALDELIEAELLRREATATDLKLEQRDRDRALVRHFDPGVEELARNLATADQETAPSASAPAAGEPTAEQVAAAQSKLKQVLEDGRVLSEQEFAQYILAPTALRLKIQDRLAAEIPTVAEQVHARHILLETEQEAKNALDLIKAGNLDFAAAAAQLSKDPGSKDKGGDVGWFPRGIMDPAFEEAAFTLEPGQISEPVNSSFGWHIIKVEEKAAERPVAADVLDYLRQSAYAKWLAAKKGDEANAITYLLDTKKADWARNNAPKPNVPARG